MAENDNIFSDHEDKAIALLIDGTEYSMSGFFSLHNAEVYLNALTETESPKKALARVISDKLKDDGDDVPIDKIETLPDDSFSEFIHAVVNDDDSLRTLFDETDCTQPIAERFALSYKAYWDQLNIIPDSVKQQIENYCRATERLRPEIEALSRIQDIIGQSPALQIGQAAQAMLNSYHAISFPAINDSVVSAAQQVSRSLGDFANSSLLMAAQQVAQTAASIIGPIQESLGQFSNMLANTIASMQFPEISDERKAELITSHKKWGEYGWCMIPHAPIKLFYNCPDTHAEADKIALSYFKKNDLNELFDDLHKMNVRKKDLNEAIACFQNRHYTACALMLFALIDAKLIRLQPKNDDKRRKTGFGAIDAYTKKFKAENHIENLFFRAFRYFNLFECLERIFENAKDFSLDLRIV